VEVFEERDALGDKGIASVACLGIVTIDEQCRAFLRYEEKRGEEWVMVSEGLKRLTCKIIGIRVVLRSRVDELHNPTSNMSSGYWRGDCGSEAHSNLGVATILEPSLKMTPTQPLQSK